MAITRTYSSPMRVVPVVADFSPTSIAGLVRVNGVWVDDQIWIAHPPPPPSVSAPSYRGVHLLRIASSRAKSAPRSRPANRARPCRSPPPPPPPRPSGSTSASAAFARMTRSCPTYRTRLSERMTLRCLWTLTGGRSCKPSSSPPRK